METVALDADTRNVTRRIILPEAGIDGVLHQHAKHSKETVCAPGLITSAIHHVDDVVALQPRDRFVAIVFAQTINDASID